MTDEEKTKLDLISMRFHQLAAQCAVIRDYMDSRNGRFDRVLSEAIGGAETLAEDSAKLVDTLTR